MRFLQVACSACFLWKFDPIRATAQPPRRYIPQDPPYEQHRHIYKSAEDSPTPRMSTEHAHHHASRPPSERVHSNRKSLTENVAPDYWRNERGGGYAAKLRANLLLNYDRGAYPWEYIWRQSGWTPPVNGTNATSSLNLRTGLPVEVSINFHRVFSLDVVSSVAAIVVWFRQRWEDPRLAWDPSEYGGLRHVWFWIGDGIAGGETSEIWSPDLELWNMETSLQRSLADAYAIVDYTGSVFWSRPGHLKPACKFHGLENFPFDTLKCTMEFGSWTYSGLYLRPVKMGTGFSIGGSETAGEAFAEYRLATEENGGITSREHVYPPYPALPEEDWPVLQYDVTFKRSWQPYVRGYVMMQVILNLAAFACFWLPPQCGERVGLAITSMLAAVASELVVAGRLPSAGEMTWFQSFSLFSLAFAVSALFECVAVVYFFYYTGDDLVPNWWPTKWSCYDRFFNRGTNVHSSMVVSSSNDSRNSRSRSVASARSALTSVSKHSRTVSKTVRQMMRKGQTPTEVPRNDADSPIAEFDLPSTKPKTKKLQSNVTEPTELYPGDGDSSDDFLPDENNNDKQKGSPQSKRVSFYEANGVHHHAESAVPTTEGRSSALPSAPRFNNSTAVHPHLRQVSSLTDYMDGLHENDEDDGSCICDDSCNNQSGAEGRRPSHVTAPIRPRPSLAKSISSLPNPGSFRLGYDADDFLGKQQANNNRRWKKVATKIDELSRVFFPVAYCVGLGLLIGSVDFI